jgi:hypothetical protein
MLYFATPSIQMMGADVIDDPKTFKWETPRRLFPLAPPAALAGWDVAPDGRFLFAAPPGSDRVIPFTVVLNWAAGLKK